ncbi:MAG: proline--tRNA ligase [Elusimicrobiota bacterium]|nr:proline--tRNA ligase [Elusimicrobiota bacterium]
MFYSKLFAPTLKEAPSDADVISAKLLIRAAMIRKMSAGLYEYLPLGLRALRKVENIIREELNSIDAQEVKLPLILPKELWDESGRWDVYGKELFRLKDRKEAQFCLAPTHEEAITNLARRDLHSYKQLPAIFHQFTQKFRDEIRPRFGIMRSREFLMSDAYSFHTDEADLDKCYEIVFDAYKKICARCGLIFRPVEAQTGAIGGSYSHEFMVLAKTGEEEIAWCECGYGANVEKASALVLENAQEKELALEKVPTPNVKTIDEVAAFFKVDAAKAVKSMIYLADQKPVLVLIRGDRQINEAKLAAVLGASEIALAQVETAMDFTGSAFGSIGPIGLKKPIQTIADISVSAISGAIVGANEDGFHYKNFRLDRDCPKPQFFDISKAQDGDICPVCKKHKLQFCRGIEVGHTFKLGTKYSKALKAHYLNAQGQSQPMVMGCYGIGVSRILAAIVEQSFDDKGIIWTDNVNPFCVEIIPIDYNDAKTKAVTLEIYNALNQNGIDVLIDDRDERAGVKFNDADLIGIPFRITIGKKTLETGNVEFKRRKDPKENIKLLSPSQAVAEILNVYKK